MPAQAVRPGVLETLQLAQTALGNGQAYACAPNIIEHIFYVVGNGAVGAGAITFETAHDPEYTGTWTVLPTFTAPATGQVNPLTVAANAVLMYKHQGVLAAVRARISTTITVGTVTVYYKGNVS